MSFLPTARFFTPDEFDTYMSTVFAFAGWKPRFVVLHNTSSPTLAQRPDGFTAQHMVNLRDFYEGKGWPSGPHLFIDQNGVWEFSDLAKPGTHSPSWNATTWGVEQLGEYETEAWDNGDGAKVARNAVCAVAAMCNRGWLDSSTVTPHKADKLTTHKDCPGRNCDMAEFRQRVHSRILVLRGLG